MQPQHVALSTSSNGSPDAQATQIRRLSAPLAACGYLFDADSTISGPKETQDFLTSLRGGRAHVASNRSIESYRRLRCQRASNFWQHSALSPSLLPVRASSRSKNMWLLIQSRSRSSQHTPVNTSKTGFTGRAFAPTPTTPEMTGGAVC